MSFLETGILRLENAFLRKGNSGSVAVEVPESRMFILGSSTHFFFCISFSCKMGELCKFPVGKWCCSV